MSHRIISETYDPETDRLVERVFRCDCGRRLLMESAWSTECRACGREYNGSGQLLAPRSQWGEETGESF